MTEKRGAELFMERIKDNPDEIIAWCRREILEYKKLIKLIEGKTKKIGHVTKKVSRSK